MDATDPDLSAFAARGGKVLMLEYMADYAQSPFAGIRYYESVVDRMGREGAPGVIRLFTAPGVDHVGSGAPGLVDMLEALDAWVETGTAPADLTLVEQEVAAPAFATKRSLPLCEWPAWPRHMGGDAARADSFECVRYEERRSDAGRIHKGAQACPATARRLQPWLPGECLCDLAPNRRSSKI